MSGRGLPFVLRGSSDRRGPRPPRLDAAMRASARAEVERVEFLRGRIAERSASGEVRLRMIREGGEP